MPVINNPKSLAELTFKTIVDNVHCYGENLSRKLAPEPRQMVLEELLKKTPIGHFRNITDKTWLAFPSFLSRETKLIDTKALAFMFGLNESHPSSDSKFPLLEVLQHLAVRAPNLQELKIDHLFQGNGWLGREEIASLSHLKNLSRLRISNCIVLHSELKEIVKNCRSLQDVEVFRLKLNIDQKIYFFDDGFLYHEIRFGSRDIKIRLDKNLPRTEHHFVDPGPHYHFVCFPTGMKNLEFLETQPHATAFTMGCTKFEKKLKVVRFPRFPKLRSATFTGCEYQNLAFRTFLEENGHLLRRLTIKPELFSGSGMIAETLEKIFGWCSNLEWFSLEYVSLSSYNVPIDRLSQLKGFRCFDSGDMRVDISSLLSAPQLERFEIKVRNLDLGDKEILFSQIAQKEILINLKRYKFDTFLKRNATDFLEGQLIAAIKSANPDVQEIHISPPSYRGGCI